MRLTPKVFLALGLLTSACDRLRTPEAPAREAVLNSLCSGEQKPLNEAERVAFSVKPEVASLLPRGPTTPVFVVSDGEPAGTRGIAFTVRPPASKFVLHSIRRQSARLEKGTAPFVFVARGPSEADQACVVMLTAYGSTLEAMLLSQLNRSGTSITDLDEFVSLWSQSTGLSLVALDEGWAEFEIDQMPEDSSEFVSGLVNFTYAGDGDADSLRSALAQSRSVRLAF